MLSAPRAGWPAAATAAAIALLSGVRCGPPSVPAPRHVLLVSIDTVRADVLGCYGDARAATETLDRLASEGVRFTAAISAAPLTLPSHACLLTGMDPWRLGVRHNGIYSLAPRFVSLAERLADAGFETAAIVAGYPLSDFSGLDQGFAIYDDAIPLESGEVYHNPERRAQEVTDAAIAWLESRPDPARPFLLFVHYYDPHAPYEPPARYRGGSSDAVDEWDAYRGEVAYVDDQIERLLGILGRDAVLDDTLVIVTSDHGEGLMEHGEPTHGVFLYDEVLRVPLILRYPPALPAGAEIDAVVGLVDVTPTILDALGLPPDPDADGRSLWGLATGSDAQSRGEVFSETQYPRLEHGWAPLRAIRTQEWKYIDAPAPELYALQDDRGESTNVLASNEPTAGRLRTSLEDAFRSATEGEAAEVTAQDLERLQALGYLQSADGADEATGPDPKTMIALDAALQRASAEIAAGRFREAEARLIDVVAGDPGNVAALSRLGDVRVVQKDFAGAERALLQALSVAQGHGRAPVLWRLAGMERRRGNYDRALDYYRQYSGIAPLSGRTVERMAATLLDAGRRDEAERALREWLADHPASLVGLQALARLLRDEGRDEEAQEMWRLILGIRPNDEEARAALSAAGGGE